MADETTEINIPYPSAEDLHFRLTVGACRLIIHPGADEWITGSYRDDSGALPLRITQEAGTVHIDQKRVFTRMFGLFSKGSPGKTSPQLELNLGTDRPFSFTLESGAGENECDFGSLPLTRLVIRQGAVRSRMNFSSPNPQQMTVLEMNSGAAEMKLTNLANANAGVMTLQGGAATYTFDFGGSLQRDCDVKMNAGMSSVTLIVPHTTAGKVDFESMLGRLDVGDGFTKQSGGYWTRAAIEGKSPVLEIRATVGLGSVELRGSESVPSVVPKEAPVGEA